MRDNRRTNRLCMIGFISPIVIWIINYLISGIMIWMVKSGMGTVNTSAIIAIVKSVITILCMIVTIIISAKGLAEIRYTNEAGKGFAIAGIVISGVSILVLVVLLLGVLIVSAFL